MGINLSGPDKGVRQRGMSAELNLVPFIDLLSVCITFLLLTAVWTQVQALQIDQGTADPNAPDPTDVEPPLTVHLSAVAIWIGRDSGAGTTFAMTRGEYDWGGVVAAVRADRARHPDASDALIVTDDGIEYQHMIRALDLTHAEGYAKTAISGHAP